MILDAGLLQVHGDYSEEIGAKIEHPVGDDAEKKQMLSLLRYLEPRQHATLYLPALCLQINRNFVECISWLGFMFNSTMIENFTINGYDKKMSRKFSLLPGSVIAVTM